MDLILLQIDIIYLENRYKNEVIPLRKYYCWEALKECYKRVGDIK